MNRAALVRIIFEKEKLKRLMERYSVTPGMPPQQIFDNFVATENHERESFYDRHLAAPTESKRLYWAARASGLTTHGGRTRLRKLLSK